MSHIHAYSLPLLFLGVKAFAWSFSPNLPTMRKGGGTLLTVWSNGRQEHTASRTRSGGGAWFLLTCREWKRQNLAWSGVGGEGKELKGEPILSSFPSIANARIIPTRPNLICKESVICSTNLCNFSQVMKHIANQEAAYRPSSKMSGFADHTCVYSHTYLH